jgi:hypothetical protein
MSMEQERYGIEGIPKCFKNSCLPQIQHWLAWDKNRAPVMNKKILFRKLIMKKCLFS